MNQCRSVYVNTLPRLTAIQSSHSIPSIHTPFPDFKEVIRLHYVESVDKIDI